MPRTPPSQTSLFGEAADPATLVTLDLPRASQGKAQQQFNKLSNQIRRERERLAIWEAFLPQLHSRLERELVPVEKEIRERQLALVRALDALIQRPPPGLRLTRKQRDKVCATLLDIVHNLQSSEADAELDALCERYTERDPEMQELEMAFTEAMLSDVFGEDFVNGHTASNVDELLQHARQQFEDHWDEQVHPKQGRSKRRASAGPQAGQPSAAEASTAVREIYRKLASALHPDREPDLAERERKTGLMQRVNQAYEKKDLLSLLGLQIEIEQIDTKQLADLPDARLKHYNQVLRQQLEALRDQLRELASPLQSWLDLEPRLEDTRAVESAVHARIRSAKRLVMSLTRDLEWLADPGRQKSWINALPDPEASLADRDFLAMLMPTTAARRKPGRRPGRRRR
ncbi:J domain-containing protein [Pseudomarimonas arenosa]|uniref:J domain-containing protein n=1 Tax=Pseudomarimonas arenosa TaxID=2774145 RepID=A0AAW3ZH36_9GAMM|nr:J domain-containing protein [Pseudomarimonas arenosa]MBD8524275.1 J domain-containing protein [Pseudomarimonas arenosa]